MNRLFLAVPWVPILLLVAAADEPTSPLKPGEPINDQSVARFLEREGKQLISTGKTLVDYKPQLDRSSCTLKLPAEGRRKLTPAEVAARAESSVVAVGSFYNCKKCSNIHTSTASGYFLTESGALATCLHVLTANQDCRGLVVLTRDGKLCAVREVLASDAKNDLAILQVDGKGFAPLPLSTNAPVGSPVTVVGHPDGHFFTVTTGAISRHFLQRRKNGSAHYLSITADFAKGSSGAPVLNEFGAVVGMVNNTESIYYNEDHGEQKNFQMTMKNCSTSEALLALIQPPSATKKAR